MGLLSNTYQIRAKVTHGTTTRIARLEIEAWLFTDIAREVANFLDADRVEIIELKKLG